MNGRKRPLLIVVSAPSGAGKTTLCDRFLADRPDAVYSVSCTTRPPRGSEADGRDYIFLSEEAFAERVARGAFLEHATVHGHRYGTLRQTVGEALGSGRTVVMDIDVQGARQIREQLRSLPDDDPLRRGFVDIFIEPPSLEVLRERLLARGEDDRDTIAQRLHNAEGEMAERHAFRYRVVNDNLEAALARFEACIDHEARL